MPMPVDSPEREKFARQVSQLCHQAFPYGEAKAGPLEPGQLTTDFILQLRSKQAPFALVKYGLSSFAHLSGCILPELSPEFLEISRSRLFRWSAINPFPG